MILHLNSHRNGLARLKKDLSNQEICPLNLNKQKRGYLQLKEMCHQTQYIKSGTLVPGNSKDFYTLDLVTDLLAGGESGRLHTKLVREKKLFSEINAYLTADIDPGLIIVQGKLMKGINIQYANESINEVIIGLISENGIKDEMEKVKNKFESSTVFSNTSILNKAANLSFFELLGNPGLINSEVDTYRNVTQEMVAEAIKRYFIFSNCSTVNYISTRKEK